MASKGNEKLTDDFLILIRHPPQCSNMLKVKCTLLSSAFVFTPPQTKSFFLGGGGYIEITQSLIIIIITFIIIVMAVVKLYNYDISW